MFISLFLIRIEWKGFKGNMKAPPFLTRKLLDASFIRLKVLRRIFINTVKGFQPFKKERKNFLVLQCRAVLKIINKGKINYQPGWSLEQKMVVHSVIAKNFTSWLVCILVSILLILYRNVRYFLLFEFCSYGKIISGL